MKNTKHRLILRLCIGFAVAMFGLSEAAMAAWSKGLEHVLGALDQRGSDRFIACMAASRALDFVRNPPA